MAVNVLIYTRVIGINMCAGHKNCMKFLSKAMIRYSMLENRNIFSSNTKAEKKSSLKDYTITDLTIITDTCYAYTELFCAGLPVTVYR